MPPCLPCRLRPWHKGRRPSTGEETRLPHAIVLVNGKSGITADDRVRDVEQALARNGVRAEVAQVAGSDLCSRAQQAVDDGVPLVVAAGGDGTVSAVAGIVQASRAALGVLPLGTLNHFARDAGIPLDLDDAAAVLARMRTRRVDLGEVNGRTFVNNASIGLYPAAVRERKALQAQGSSKRLAMVRAAGTVLRQVPAHHLRISLDGRTAVRTTSFLAVANNPYDLTLGSFGQRPALDGATLAVYTMRRPGRRAVLGLAARALVGRLDEAKDFEGHLAREVRVDTVRGQLRAGIDGELVHLATPLRFRTLPAALRLVVPAADPRGVPDRGA